MEVLLLAIVLLILMLPVIALVVRVITAENEARASAPPERTQPK